MITGALFHTLAFPWLLINPNSEIVEGGPGTLFLSVLDADAKASTATFCRNAPAGFSGGPSGYAVYIHDMPFLRGYRLALYGLKVVGVSTVQGKSETLSIRLEREDIKGYVERFVGAAEHSAKVVGDLLTSSVHEIRGINTDVKHASQEILAQEYEPEICLGKILERAKNINALSEILSRRTDFLEFVTNPYMILKRRRIRVYQKFDKVRRSLESRANQRGITLRFGGSSVGSIDALIVFEIVPYLMIQNAIKYAPSTSEVVIWAEDLAGTIVFTVTNWGPRLDPDELEAVFEQGVRGRRAAAAGVRGSGVGLHFLKELVEVHHGGRIEFMQEAQPRWHEKVEHLWTVVRLTLPRAE